MTRASPESIQQISAEQGAATWQKIVPVVLIALIIGCAKVNLLFTITVIVSTPIALSFLAELFNSYLWVMSFREEAMAQKPAVLLSDENCPHAAIVSALHKEGSDVIVPLLKGLDRIDYPKDKRHVLLVIDEGDDVTQQALGQQELPQGFEVITVPSHAYGPKGKPRALEFMREHRQALLAHCQMLVIFDAEGIPDPQGLRAVATLWQDPKYATTGCFQGTLAQYNSKLNWFTRMFAIHYATAFTVRLRGLAGAKLPVPLGGTTNYLRMDALTEAGGWDQFNVTEDADLGIRIARLGYKTVMVDSTTLEQATSTFKSQVNQTSRWRKGFAMTFIVHTRNPFRLLREVGPLGSIALAAVVGGALPFSIFAPFYWSLTCIWVCTRLGLIQQIIPQPIEYMGMLAMISNLLNIYHTWYGIRRTQQYSLFLWSFTYPFHLWTVGFRASVKAAREILWGDPYYWDKTSHKLSEAEGMAAHKLLGSVYSIPTEG